MSNTEKRFEKTGLAFLFTIIFMLAIWLQSNISNGQTTKFYNAIVVFLTIILLVLVIITITYSIKYISFLLDAYIDDMLSGKKIQPRNQFYCKVCKFAVELDDDYCPTCGMML